ncbi:hypothetical protein GA0115246_1013610, partial [Streptomyces sp. SolWspMP-sol7th]
TNYDLASPRTWIGLRNYEYLFTQDPASARPPSTRSGSW